MTTDSDDDTWVGVAVVLVPLVGGLLIGRAWALLIALTPLVLYALDRDTGELAAWFAITFLISGRGCCAPTR